MNKDKFTKILYIIILVITATTAIQVYWNYNSFLNNKQQLKNDIQFSLDKAVNNYFENLAKQNTLGFKVDSAHQKSFLQKGGKFESIISELKFDHNGVNFIENTNHHHMDGISIINSEITENSNPTKHRFDISDSIGKQEWLIFIDSMKSKKEQKNIPLEFLTSKVVISITNEELNLNSIDSFLSNELKAKNIKLNYALQLLKNDSIKTNTNPSIITKSQTPLKSNSLLINEDEDLQLFLKDETGFILKRILGEIIISVLLILALVACLIYLLKIINKQKQLVEIKNDLISNITHEFKTPITTIGIAIESIKDFNKTTIDDRSNKYLDLSSTQLSKLNIMVEKLLETATLDSGELKLNKSKVNIVTLIENLIEKHKFQTETKTISFKTNNKSLLLDIDKFHFENALNNLLDNAIKYGGKSISIEIITSTKESIITISDSGNSLTKKQSQQIFEKFYRVPKGNTHDVKGFGIGLYYTKKIIEKHMSQINVSIKPNTSFKITIPNE